VSLRRHCHGNSGLRPRWWLSGQGDDKNQLQGVPVPSRHYPAGDLALSPVHTELSRRRRFVGGTPHHGLLYYETVRRWVNHFGPNIVETALGHRRDPGDLTPGRLGLNSHRLSDGSPCSRGSGATRSTQEREQHIRRVHNPHRQVHAGDIEHYQRHCLCCCHSCSMYDAAACSAVGQKILRSPILSASCATCSSTLVPDVSVTSRGGGDNE
jgi:hypothetical protein